MPETSASRPLRVAAKPQQRYQAVVEIVYPTDYDARRRQVAGERVDVEWAKIAPGESVPENVIAESPWLIKKGRVEKIEDTPASEAPAEEGGR